MVRKKNNLHLPSILVGFLVVVGFLVAAGLVIGQASGPQPVGHSMDSIWCTNPLGCIISSWIRDGEVKAVDVDSSEVQLRVSQDCDTGLTTDGGILGVNEDGTVNCTTDAGTTFVTQIADDPTASGTLHVAQVKCTSPLAFFMVSCSRDYVFTGGIQGIVEDKTQMTFIGGELTATCVATIRTGLSSSVTVTAKALCSN